MLRTSVLTLALLAAGPAVAQETSFGNDNTAATESSGDGPEMNLRTPSALTIVASNGVALPVLDLDPDGNGVISVEEAEQARAFAANTLSTTGECEAVIVSPGSAEEIAAIEAASHIALAMVCADREGLTSAQRAAIAANSALMNRLSTAGYSLGDVAGLVLDADGRGTLYLSAS
jgi:hypothetical protein